MSPDSQPPDGSAGSPPAASPPPANEQWPSPGLGPSDGAVPAGLAAAPSEGPSPVIEPFAVVPEPAAEPGPTSAVAVPEPARSAQRGRGRAIRRAAGVVGVAVLAIALFTGGALTDRSGVLGGPAAEPTPQDPTQFALIQQAWDLLRTQYVRANAVDPTKMAYGAITGMTQAIDDKGHTGFLTPADRKANQAELSGTYVGVGIELDINDNGVPVINGVIHGGPSEAAGILPGDAIVAVDGKATRNVPLETIASSVRGAAGTSVTLTIARPGTTAPLSFTLTRAEIKLPPVGSAMIPGTSIAMLRVEQFSSGAGDAFASQLKALLAQHPSGLVLDLRGDPGGYVSEAVSIASQFLTSGDVYITRDASGKETPVAVKPGALAPSLPLVVLVDAGSASSAEIVAGALQDAGRARLVGTTTFGTGTVVAEYPLADGSALRIGTIEWLTPKQQPIWGHGITPTDTVALPQGIRPVTPDDLAALGAAGVAATTDGQLAKAIALLESGASTPPSPAASTPASPSASTASPSPSAAPSPAPPSTAAPSPSS